MTREWSDVVAFFEDLCRAHPQFRPIANLATAIAQSGYAQALHPWTTMHELCIAQTASERRHLQPHLRIELTGESTLKFRYLDTGDSTLQWSREVSPEHAFERFESFCEQLNWFGGTRRVPPT